MKHFLQLQKVKIAREKNNGSAAGGGAAPELRAPRSGASKQLTIFFEISSNFSKNEHQKGNRVGSWGSAGCARPRRQRCKGIFKVWPESPIRMKEQKKKRKN